MFGMLLKYDNTVLWNNNTNKENKNQKLYKDALIFVTLWIESHK